MPDVRIPLAPLIPHLKAYIEQQYPWWKHGRGNTPHTVAPSGAKIMAERVGCEETLIRKMIGGSPAETIEFNLADRILCEMHATLLWYTDPALHEVYMSADLSDTPEFVIDPSLGPEYPCGHPRTPENSRLVNKSVKETLCCRECRRQYDSDRRARRRAQLEQAA